VFTAFSDDRATDYVLRSSNPDDLKYQTVLKLAVRTLFGVGQFLENEYPIYFHMSEDDKEVASWCETIWLRHLAGRYSHEARLFLTLRELRLVPSILSYRTPVAF